MEYPNEGGGMNATVVKKSMHGMETLFRQLRNMTLKKPSTGKRKKAPGASSMSRKKRG